jgi:hypothetical protein
MELSLHLNHLSANKQQPRLIRHLRKKVWGHGISSHLSRDMTNIIHSIINLPVRILRTIKLCFNSAWFNFGCAEQTATLFEVEIWLLEMV